jgi:hypothetical protein
VDDALDRLGDELDRRDIAALAEEKRNHKLQH